MNERPKLLPASAGLADSTLCVLNWNAVSLSNSEPLNGVCETSYAIYVSEFQVEGKSGASSRGNTSSTGLYNHCCG